ncbi:MAG: sulfatase-like hydrolase/transferase [Planctomycetota bacterium]|jgi:arylsulfatase A-like enzyme/tetratricopeptide (TPR) repeat protein
MTRKRIIPVALLLCVFVLSLAVAGWWFGARRTKTTHVILISIDTLRADHLGCYGYPKDITPNIDGLAAEGVRFANVVSPVPLTLPSHSSILTGATPVRHGVHKNESNRLADSNVTLAEILQAEGYATGAIVSSFILDSQFGLRQGFDSYNDEFPISTREAKFSERKAGATTRLAVEWLEQHAKDEKAFLFLHYYDPHVEYEPPQPFASQWRGDPYAGEVAYVDHCVGQVLRKLKEFGLYERSIVILTSDHGEMLGDHGELTHGYFIYESAIKVPLIVKLPGHSRSRDVARIAGLVDIVPTICGAVGIAPPPHVDGKDLRDDLLGRAAGQSERRLYCESTVAQNYGANPLLGMVGQQWKYIETTRPEFYDLDADPKEATNLYARHPHRVREMSDVLKSVIVAQGAAAPQSKVALSAEARARLESLGYISVGETGDVTMQADKPDAKDLLDYHQTLLKCMMSLQPGRSRAEDIPIMRKLVAQRPQVVVSRWVLAKMLAAHSEYAEALEHYNELLRQRPNDAASYGQRGYVREKLGDMQGAMADYGRSIELESDETHSRMLYGRLLAKQGKFRQALANVNEVLRADPSMRGAWYLRGTIYVNLGDLKAALSDYDEQIRREPNHVGAHMNRGSVRFQLGDPQGAVDDWHDVMRLKPDAVGAYVNAAKARSRMGDRAGAIVELERCLENVPEGQVQQIQRIEAILSQLRRGASQ